MAKIDDELVARVASYLDDPDDRYGLWRVLLFMEANALPLSLPAEMLHAYLVDCRSPLSSLLPLSIEDERLIVLKLRDIIRIRLGISALSQQEKELFHYEVPVRQPKTPRTRPEPVMASELWQPPQSDVDEILEILNRDNPDLVRGVQITYKYNSHIEGREDLWLYSLWATDAIDLVVQDARPDLDCLDQQQLVLAVLRQIENST